MLKHSIKYGTKDIVDTLWHTVILVFNQKGVSCLFYEHDIQKIIVPFNFYIYHTPIIVFIENKDIMYLTQSYPG